MHYNDCGGGTPMVFIHAWRLTTDHESWDGVAW